MNQNILKFYFVNVKYNMPSKQPKTCSANAIFLDTHMCNLLIAAIESPDGTASPIAPDLVLNLVTTYGVELVASYIGNPDDDFDGKITRENLAMALAACDADSICSALKACVWNAVGGTPTLVWKNYAELKASAVLGVATWPGTTANPETYGPGALLITDQPKLMAQFLANSTDLSCVTKADLYHIAGGTGLFQSMMTPISPATTASDAQVKDMLKVAHNMWALDSATDTVACMREVFGDQALFYIYQCPGSTVQPALCTTTDITVKGVLASEAFGKIEGKFTNTEPSHFNTMNCAPWIKCGSASFVENEVNSKILKDCREIAFLFCHATKAEIKAAVLCERALYCAGTDEWTTFSGAGKAPVSTFLNRVYDSLSTEFVECFDQIIQVSKFVPSTSVGLSDMSRVYPGLNMCQLINCIDALKASNDDCVLVTLGSELTLLTAVDVATGQAAEPDFTDDNSPVLSSHLVAVGNAILLQSYFSTSQKCVTVDGKKGGKIDAGSLLNLTFITGVFSASSGTGHKNLPTAGTRDCSAYESPEAFCAVLAKFYAQNPNTYNVFNKVSSWTTGASDGGTDLDVELPVVTSIVVPTDDAFVNFAGYAAHVSGYVQHLICKVVPLNALPALVATINDVDDANTGDAADDLFTFFYDLAKKFDFCKALDAWYCVMKTQDSNTLGNDGKTASSAPSFQGGQKVVPVSGETSSTANQLQRIVLHVLNCGTKEEICMLFGKKIEVLKQVLSGLSVDTDKNALASAMLSAIKLKINSAKIIEAFTIECGAGVTLATNQHRVYTILEAALATTSPADDSATNYILSKVIKSCPVSEIIQYIGAAEVAEYLTTKFAQTVISSFTIEEVLACGNVVKTSDSSAPVTFDDLVFIVNGYHMDANGCLEACLNLPWPLADYERVFGEDCLNDETCPEDEDATKHAINTFLRGN